MCSAPEDDDQRAGRGPGADTPVPAPAPIDPRVRAAWRSWLSALATDADAAMAAALAYESLPEDGREAWLDALESDAATLDVPKIALYAPLLAVEPPGPRKQRIERAIDDTPAANRETRALRGIAPDGAHVCVLVSPVYLDFVQLLVCRYTPTGGFTAVRHDAMRHAADVPQGPSTLVDGVTVEATPVRVVVEELAHAILADRRARREVPSALTHFAYLFGPHRDPD